MLVMWCCTTNEPEPLSQDRSQYRPPSMNDLIGETVNARRVNCIHIGCDASVAAIGLVLLAGAVTLFVLTYQASGWLNQTLPNYILLGGVGLIGLTLSILGMKWMVESCNKYHQFHTDLNEVT